MTKILAVAGKGGTGKTTFAALAVKYLLAANKGTILAVDADPNANLNEALGVPLRHAVADILAEVKDGRSVPPGMTKEVFVQYKFQQSIIETAKMDLLVMGGPQGPGCYCYPNDLLRRYLERQAANYDYLIVDSEAGLEHLSRRTIPRADILFVMSDATARGVRSAGRIKDIVTLLRTPITRSYLVVTRAEAGLELLSGEIRASGLDLLGIVPFDNDVVQYDLAGLPLIDLPDTAPAVQAVYRLLQCAGI